MNPKKAGRRRLAILVLALTAVVAGWFITLEPRLELARIDIASPGDLRRQVESKPGNIRFSLATAQRLLHLGYAREALSWLTRVRTQRESAGQSEQALFDGLMAKGEMLTGQVDGALADAQRALALDPSCVPAYYAQGLWRERQARWTEAGTVFSSIVQADPADDTAKFHLASDDIKLADEKAALPLLQRVCSLDPSSYLYHRALAADLAYLGEFDDATAVFQQALKLNPASFEARANVVRAGSFASQTPGQCQRQEVPMDRLLKGQPGKEDPDADLDHEILGMLELHAGDTVGAQFHLEAAARVVRRRPRTLDTFHPSVFLNLAVIRALNGQTQRSTEAQNEYDSVHGIIAEVDRLTVLIKQRPDNAVARLQLARLYERYQALPEALGQYEALLRLHIFENDARARRDALASRLPEPEADSAWAWRVISTETGMAYAGKRPSQH